MYDRTYVHNVYTEQANNTHSSKSSEYDEKKGTQRISKKEEEEGRKKN